MSVGIVDVWVAEGTGAPPLPVVTGAFALDSTTVRVTFDQEMKHASAGNPDDTLNPANYAFTGNLSAVNATLTQADPTHIDVAVNEMLQGAAYQVQVSNVENLDGAIIDPLGNTAGFIGIGVAPGVLAAVAQDENTVRVVFNEPMKNDVALTTPGNYSFTGGLIATIALRIASMYVDVTVNEMKDGQSYTVTVSNVSDLAGNGIAPPPDNQTDFSGIGVAPQLLPTVDPVLGDDQSIYIDYDEAVQVPTAENADNYEIVPSLGSLAVTQVTTIRYKVTFTAAISPGNPYTITANDILDTAGNSIDLAHNGATWIGTVSTPFLYFYPGNLVSNILPRTPLRIQAIDKMPASSGIDIATWDIWLEVMMPDGKIFRSDVLRNGVTKDGYAVEFFGGASDASDGIFARFLPKVGYWPEGSTIKILSVVSDNEGYTASTWWNCYIGKFECFENRLPGLSALDQALVTGNTTRFPSTDRLRRLLMRACTTSLKTQVQARTLTWLAAATDLKTVLASLGNLEDVVLCERARVLDVYNALLKNHTIAAAAKNEMQRLFERRTLEPFLRYATSASPQHVVSAFCGLVVLAVTTDV